MAAHVTYQPEEISRRGQEIFDKIRLKLSSKDIDHFIAIDIVSGDYVVDQNDFEATERLIAKQPDAKIWLARVGQPAAYRIGGPISSGGQE